MVRIRKATAKTRLDEQMSSVHIGRQLGKKKKKVRKERKFKRHGRMANLIKSKGKKVEKEKEKEKEVVFRQSMR